MNDHTHRIISIMADKQMTPAQFSSVTGIPTGNLSHILNGRHKPSLAVLQKILNQLTDINPDWLLSGNGTMKKAPERNDGTKIENQTSRNTSPEVNQTSRKTLPEMNQANRNTLPEVNQPSQNSPPENEKTKRLPTPARETDLFKSPQIHKQPAADTR